MCIIRSMNFEDLNRCGEIYAAAFPQEHWGIDWNSENAKEYLKEFYEQKHFVGFVAVEADEIVGLLCACSKINGSCRELYLNEMAVLPEKQGHGIGKQLLGALKEYKNSHNQAGIVLYTSEYAPAKSFYERNDFALSQGTICMYWV